jgi:signal transduction histidine kinase
MNMAPVQILLVEDSPSDAVLLQESLIQNGQGRFEFTHVESLAEGLEHLRQGRFDVLLLDLSLPDSAGPETFHRARDAAPHLPIVVMTSIEDEALSLEAVRHGIQDYLIKGQAYGRQTARSIRYAIERKRAEEALQKAQAGLERKVEERTAQLSEANRDLRAEIAQRVRAEEAHRQVLRRLKGAEETERGRISRELHDRLGGDLTAVKLGLQMVNKQGPFSPSVQASISQLEKLADSTMQDIHRLAWELRPAVLDDFGLDKALRRYASEWAGLNGVAVDFHSQGVEKNRLPAELETTLYRITQEALTNVLRHAKAQHVSIFLERRPDHVLLIVEDDGQGFDAEAVLKVADACGKLGLLGMRERVTLAGGTIEFESTPGAGATVYVRVPLESVMPAASQST